MIKKTIKYTDFNGDERVEDLYFHLSEAEVAELEVSEEGGLVNKINQIVEAKDGAEIIRIFKYLILHSYGEKSTDGRLFVKSEELRTKFSQCPAYSQLFMELATDADKAAEFVNGLVPQARPKPPSNHPTRG